MHHKQREGNDKQDKAAKWADETNAASNFGINKIFIRLNPTFLFYYHIYLSGTTNFAVKPRNSRKQIFKTIISNN
jgi:hypothetical protein